MGQGELGESTSHGQPGSDTGHQQRGSWGQNSPSVRGTRPRSREAARCPGDPNTAAAFLPEMLKVTSFEPYQECSHRLCSAVLGSRWGVEVRGQIGMDEPTCCNAREDFPHMAPPRLPRALYQDLCHPGSCSLQSIPNPSRAHGGQVYHSGSLCR